MKFSYWENKTWLSNIDFVIVGSGIVGLNCALELRAKYPKSKIVVLEKGLIPHGASSRNARIYFKKGLSYWSKILKELLI